MDPLVPQQETLRCWMGFCSHQRIKHWRQWATLVFLSLPTRVLIDVPPLGSGKQPHCLCAGDCPASWAAGTLFFPLPVLFLCHENPVKSFSQCSESVQGRCANTRVACGSPGWGPRCISKRWNRNIPQVIMAPAAGAELGSPEDSCFLGWF